MAQPIYGTDKDGNVVPLRVGWRGRLNTGPLWWGLLLVALQLVTALGVLGILALLWHGG